jgi:hypothetical protein
MAPRPHARVAVLCVTAVPLLIGDLEHAHAAPDLYFQMDRANAIRLLKALAAAGMDTRTPRAE